MLWVIILLLLIAGVVATVLVMKKTDNTIFVVEDINEDFNISDDNLENEKEGVKYLISPGFVPPEDYQEFLDNQLVCEGESEFIENNPMIADMPQYAWCYGELIPKNLKTGTTTVMVPLSTHGTVGEIGPVGCGGYLNLYEFEVPETLAVLAATFSTIFTVGSQPLGEKGGINIAAHHVFSSIGTTLEFINVELVNGIAHLYLEGTILANHCGDPLFKAQIEHAAFQYPTVNGLIVYLNGEVYDWCKLDQSNGEGGCPEVPRLWVTDAPE